MATEAVAGLEVAMAAAAAEVVGVVAVAAAVPMVLRDQATGALR